MTTPTPRIAKEDLTTLLNQSSRYVSFERDERITSLGRPICDCCGLGCNDVIHFCSTPKGPWQGINSVNGMVCVQCAREAGLQIHKSYGELERDLAAAREELVRERMAQTNVEMAHAQEKNELRQQLAAAQEALENIETSLRRAGATLPAPESTGTIEGAMNAGLCMALCVVVDERERVMGAALSPTKPPHTDGVAR